MSEIWHFGILGMKWGVRRYQNKDGSLTALGRKRYLNPDGSLTKKGEKELGDAQKSKLAGEKEFSDKMNARYRQIFDSDGGLEGELDRVMKPDTRKAVADMKTMFEKIDETDEDTFNKSFNDTVRKMARDLGVSGTESTLSEFLQNYFDDRDSITPASKKSLTPHREKVEQFKKDFNNGSLATKLDKKWDAESQKALDALKRAAKALDMFDKSKSGDSTARAALANALSKSEQGLVYQLLQNLGFDTKSKEFNGDSDMLKDMLKDYISKRYNQK